MRLGFYVVMSRPPGPESDFVELEDHLGKWVKLPGAEWTQRPDGLWQFGPFGPAPEAPPDPDPGAELAT